MDDETLDMPPFPPLRWDGYSWSGVITLPSWAGFQSRLGMYASESEETASDGAVRLSVSSPTEGVRASPSPQQAAALRHLIDNEAAVAAAVVRALFEYYPEQRESRLEWLGEDDNLPIISDAGELRSLVGLGTVHVVAESRDAMAFVGFEFGCEWDEEHGAGVMTNRGQVIEVGQADTSFSAPFDEEDDEDDEDEDDE